MSEEKTRTMWSNAMLGRSGDDESSASSDSFLFNSGEEEARDKVPPLAVGTPMSSLDSNLPPPIKMKYRPKSKNSKGKDDDETLTQGTDEDLPTTYKMKYRPQGPSKSSIVEKMETVGATPIAIKQTAKPNDSSGHKHLHDEIEKAIKRHDINGDGVLDNTEIYQIVKDVLRSQSDVRLYKRLSCALAFLVALLALSNFGTSWATAMLSKDTVADADSGTVQSSASGEVIGFQNVAFTIDMAELNEEEFEQRRALVESELISDPDHEDHVHRQLGKRDKKLKLGSKKIAYDHGKITERDLKEIIRRCESANTVNCIRGWKDLGDEDQVMTTICDPGTQIVRKGRKKSNKKKTKVKVVDDLVVFRSRGMNGRDTSIGFTCNKGDCYASGGGITQGQGHPCRIEFDYEGASECDDGLVCYHPDSSKIRGTGECARLQKYAPPLAMCQMDFGVNACEVGYACYPMDSGRRSTPNFKVGVIDTGICQRVVTQADFTEVCDVSYGSNACVAGYGCLATNGRVIHQGLGYCSKLRSAVDTSRAGWYVDYEIHKCVQSCSSGPFCGGEVEDYEETWPSAQACCDGQLSWMSRRDCVPDGYNWSENVF